MLLHSCISINIQPLSETPGFYSGYHLLSYEDRNNIVFLKEDEKIANLNIENKVYAIHAKQLQDFMLQYDSCLVYFWTAHCSGSACISPLACQEFCDKNNYQLIMIADDYHSFPEMYLIMPLIKNPFFAVNANYYKTDYCNRYKKRFEKELLKNAQNKKQEHGRFLFFVNGKYQRRVSQLF